MVVVDEIDNTETLLFNESQLTNNSTRNYDVRFEDSDESSSHSSVDDASDHENNILVMDEYLPLEDGEDFGEFVSNTNQLAGEEEKIGYSIDDEINEITNISQGNSNASSRFTVDCTGSNSTIGIQPLSKGLMYYLLMN